MKSPAQYEIYRVCSLAINAYGQEKQLNHVVEELNELGVAVNHWRRGRVSIDAVLEEMADVAIMLEQLSILIELKDGDLADRVWEKLKKLEKKIDG